MGDSIDTSVLVASIVAGESAHSTCRKIVASGAAALYSHGLSETFSTLTGGRSPFRMPAKLATQILAESFAPRLAVISLTAKEMLTAMGDCERRGVRGGAIFDFFHLAAARKAKSAKLYTLDVSNFSAFHRDGDPEIVHPDSA